MQDRYWTLETGGGIQAAGDKRYKLDTFRITKLLTRTHFQLFQCFIRSNLARRRFGLLPCQQRQVRHDQTFRTLIRNRRVR